MDKRVLMLLSHFPPVAYAGVFRSLRFVRYLGAYGWEPVVLTQSARACASRPQDAALSERIPSGVMVARANVWRPAEALRRTGIGWLSRRGGGVSSSPVEGGSTNESEVKRLLRFADRVLSSLCETPDVDVGWTLPAIRRGLSLIQEYRPRVVYSTGPPHSSHFVAALLARLTALPLVLDFRDPWARTAWSRRHEGSFKRAVHRGLERLCVKRASHVLLNTTRLRDEFLEAYPDLEPERFSTLHNGYDPELLESAAGLVREAAPDPLRVGIHACHPGAVYGRRSLRPLIEALGRLASAGRHVTLEQVGYVDDRNRNGLRDYVETCGLSGRVVLRDRIPHGDTLRRMAAANLLVVIQPDTTMQVPGKLFEMLLFGKPILGLTGDGETADIIREHGLGVVADPYDSRQIVDAIERLVAEDGRAGVPDGAMSAFDGHRLTGRLAARLDEACGDAA